ncbi:hypothetical protein N0V88_003868 [Collariella sp. IMI 366227]|nr:hypothetical protein N0V88_003868 [Collariella sp. IMI 366227]
MAGLSDLPGEILLHILSFLDPVHLTTVQLVSRGFRNLARDNGFWRVHCLQESAFLETLDQRRRYYKLDDRDARHPAARVFSAGANNGVANGGHGNDFGATLLSTTTGENEDDGEGGKERRSKVTLSPEAKERERVRIMANWDPCFPSEKVSWYEEYIQRYAPVAVNWMQHAYIPDRERPSAADFVEARGAALYYPDGELGETVLAVSPMDDGSVCLWDVGGTKGKRGAIVARSRPGILFIDGPGADNHMRSKRVDSGVTECVSVDSQLHRAFFAVQSHLIEVDLQRLSVVDCESFPWSITALSTASPTVPLTVGTSLGIHLHDYRSRKPPRNDQGEVIDVFDRMGAQAFYERSLQHIFDDEPLPPYAPLSQPGPLSILHLQQPGQEADLSDDIYVAGRFSNILHYDRRKFPSIRGSIHSGARLCSMTSLPYPFSTFDSELRRLGELSTEQVKASKSAPGGRTLIACGEYNTKGSLELYGLSPTPLDNIATTAGSLQNSTLKNRQTCSRSKLLSVVNHGTRLAFSDGSGCITWFERDGLTEVRRERIGHSERHTPGESLFASMPGSDDIARKLLPLRPGGVNQIGDEEMDGEEERGQGGNKSNINNGLLFWTGEKLGLVTFSGRPGFKAEEFEEAREEAAHEAETLGSGQRPPGW